MVLYQTGMDYEVQTSFFVEFWRWSHYFVMVPFLWNKQGFNQLWMEGEFIPVLLPCVVSQG